jgi:hypothetical protein
MSAVGVILIVLAIVVLLLLAGGIVGARRRDLVGEEHYARRVSEADQALERARAIDRGWDREVMEDAARRALAEARPGWAYGALQLVLVDDRPGADEDCAHFMAFGPGDEARVVLARQGDDWTAERVE